MGGSVWFRVPASSRQRVLQVDLGGREAAVDVLAGSGTTGVSGCSRLPFFLGAPSVAAATGET